MKQDVIKNSIDFLAANDMEYANYAFEHLTFVTQIDLYSDKCGQRELDKLEQDFNKDMDRGHKKTKANLWKYIKEDDGGKDDSEDEGKKGGDKKEKKQEIQDTTVS